MTRQSDPEFFARYMEGQQTGLGQGFGGALGNMQRTLEQVVTAPPPPPPPPPVMGSPTAQAYPRVPATPWQTGRRPQAAARPDSRDAVVYIVMIALTVAGALTGAGTAAAQPAIPLWLGLVGGAVAGFFTLSILAGIWEFFVELLEGLVNLVIALAMVAAVLTAIFVAFGIVGLIFA